MFFILAGIFLYHLVTILTLKFLDFPKDTCRYVKGSLKNSKYVL